MDFRHNAFTVPSGITYPTNRGHGTNKKRMKIYGGKIIRRWMKEKMKESI